MAAFRDLRVAFELAPAGAMIRLTLVVGLSLRLGRLGRVLDGWCLAA